MVSYAGQAKVHNRRQRLVPANGVDVPGVGAAATAQHAQLRKLLAQCRVPGPEVLDVADVQRLGRVQLGVAHRRSVGP